MNEANLNEANLNLTVLEVVHINCRNCGTIPLSPSDERIFFSSGTNMSGKCPSCGKNPLKILKKQKSLFIPNEET